MRAPDRLGCAQSEGRRVAMAVVAGVVMAHAVVAVVLPAAWLNGSSDFCGLIE